MRRLLLLIVCCVAVAGCGRKPADDDWFPLAEGHRWTYRVTTTGDDGSAERETLTLRTLGPQTLAMLDDHAAWQRRSDDGVDYWLRADASGIYRVGSKTDLDAEPRWDKPQRFVLKAPFQPGTQWQAGTTAYLLARRNDFPREIRHTHPNVPMNYQIETLDDAVDTPAGHFAHCLRVRGIAALRLYADAAGGWRDMTLTTLEWYCRGVGLVKLERQEPARTAFLSGGTRTLELESFK